MNKLRLPSIGAVLAALGVLMLASSEDEKAFEAAFEMFASAPNIQAAALVVLVMWFESAVKKLGVIDAVAARLEKSESKSMLWTVPGVMGLIPSAAGARMSTAVVGILGRSSNADGLQLAAVNFWFRHVLVFCNPLISGTILACALSGASPAAIAAMGVPAAALFTAFGWVFFIKPLKCTSNCRRRNSSAIKADEAVLLLLVVAAAAGSLAGSLSFLALMSIPAAYAGMLLAGRQGAYALAGSLVLSRRDAGLLIEVVLLMWFGAACRASGAVDAAAQAAAAIGIHPLASAAAAAFAASFATGASLPSAAIAAPLAASLFPGSTSAVFAVLFAGFSAQFLTPSHLCLPISAEYFGRSSSSLILKILPAFCASLTCGALLCAAYFAAESA